MKSRDGHEIVQGDAVWVWSEEKREFYSHVVGKVHKFKIEYEVMCSITGYVGARHSLVYKNKPDQRPDSTLVIG